MKNAIFFLLLLGTIFANPKNPEVVSGSAKFESALPDNLLISSGDKTIIEWQDFSVGPTEIVSFLQPAPSSVVLNRVVGMSPSDILGRLESNGAIWLINPYGILIGKDAVIDVAAFLASTLDIQNQDFENQKGEFIGPSEEKIIHLGTIKASDGDVFLLGKHIENNGWIETENGSVNLTGANEVFVQFETEAPLFLRTSSGRLKKQLEQGGSLYELVCSDSEAKADGLMGLNSSPSISLNGTIIAREESKGGHVTIQADQIDLGEESFIDVSHEKNGGGVWIGYSQASPFYSFPSVGILMQKGAQIYASSLENGDGGKVVLFSQGATFFQGEIVSRGGHHSGNGGLVQVVGQCYLNFDGRVDVSSYQGLAGSFFTSPEVILTP